MAGNYALIGRDLVRRATVTDDQAEIRYILPISPEGPHRPFASCVKTIPSRNREDIRQHTSPAGISSRRLHRSKLVCASGAAGTRPGRR